MIDFKNTIEFKIYADVWNFHKRFYELGKTDAWWDEVISESRAVVDKYNGNAKELARDLIVAVLGDLERKEKMGAKKE